MDTPEATDRLSLVRVCLTSVTALVLLSGVVFTLWIANRTSSRDLQVVSFYVVVSQNSLLPLGEIWPVNHPSNLLRDAGGAGLTRIQTTMSNYLPYENSNSSGIVWVAEYENRKVEVDVSREKNFGDRVHVRVDADIHVHLIIIEIDAAGNGVSGVSEVLVPPGRFDHMIRVEDSVDPSQFEPIQPRN